MISDSLGPMYNCWLCAKYTSWNQNTKWGTSYISIICWDGSRGCKLLMRLDLCIATYAWMFPQEFNSLRAVRYIRLHCTIIQFYVFVTTVLASAHKTASHSSTPSYDTPYNNIINTFYGSYGREITSNLPLIINQNLLLVFINSFHDFSFLPFSLPRFLRATYWRQGVFDRESWENATVGMAYPWMVCGYVCDSLWMEERLTCVDYYNLAPTPRNNSLYSDESVLDDYRASIHPPDCTRTMHTHLKVRRMTHNHSPHPSLL